MHSSGVGHAVMIVEGLLVWWTKKAVISAFDQWEGLNVLLVAE